MCAVSLQVIIGLHTAFKHLCAERLGPVLEAGTTPAAGKEGNIFEAFDPVAGGMVQRTPSSIGGCGVGWDAGGQVQSGGAGRARRAGGGRTLVGGAGAV